MRTPRLATKGALLLWLPATLLIAACANTSMNNLIGPAAEPPSIPAEALVGRWGLAAYQREEDRNRTELEARRQCRQAYEIARGPNGGVLMHLADSAQPEELVLKGLAGGKTFVGPQGEAGGQQDREIVSFDDRIMVMRWVDTEVAARYGTSIYVKCDTPPAKAKKKAAPKAAKSKAKAPPAQKQKGPVFMAPPGQEPDEPDEPDQPAN